MKSIAIIGGGIAGISAAYDLVNKDTDYKITLFEKNASVGGRTKSIKFKKIKNKDNIEQAHIVDIGAGWLTNFYRETFDILENILKIDLCTNIRDKSIRGASDVYLYKDSCIFDDENGDSNNKNNEMSNNEEGSLKERIALPLPLTYDMIRESKLFTEKEKEILINYIDEFKKEDIKEIFNPDLEFDNRSALEEYSSLNSNNIINSFAVPLFEGPFFSYLNELSSTMTNVWLKSIFHPDIKFFQMKNGMNDICNLLLDSIINNIDIFLSTNVTDISYNHESSTCSVTYQNNNSDEILTDHFDYVIVAIPAPYASNLFNNIVDLSSELSFNFDLLNVKYAPHIRVYAARKQIDLTEDDLNIGLHLVPPIDPITTVELFSSKYAAWGSIPDDHIWALICTTREFSRFHIQQNTSDKDIIKILFNKGRSIIPELFDIESAEYIHVVKWESAIAILEKNNCQMINDYQPIKETISFCGDYLYPASSCIESAIRSSKKLTQHF